MTRTYVSGANAYFNADLIAQFKDNMPLLFRTPYESIWRVLHIDGFEPGLPKLPRSRGCQVQFFQGVTYRK